MKHIKAIRPQDQKLFLPIFALNIHVFVSLILKSLDDHYIVVDFDKMSLNLWRKKLVNKEGIL